MRSSLDAQTGLPLFLAFYKLLVRRDGGATGFLLRVYSAYRCLRYSLSSLALPAMLVLLAVYYLFIHPLFLHHFLPTPAMAKKEDH
jgi:hypothetical protein